MTDYTLDAALERVKELERERDAAREALVDNAVMADLSNENERLRTERDAAREACAELIAAMEETPIVTPGFGLRVSLAFSRIRDVAALAQPPASGEQKEG